MSVPSATLFAATAFAVVAVVAVVALPLSAPLKVDAVIVPVLGLYVNPLSCFTAVSAPVVVSAKYTKKFVLVASSFATVAPAAAKLSVPAPSLTSAYPLTLASALGSVQVMSLATVPADWNATKLLASLS